jgi:hypothetical protein
VSRYSLAYRQHLDDVLWILAAFPSEHEVLRPDPGRQLLCRYTGGGTIQRAAWRLHCAVSQICPTNRRRQAWPPVVTMGCSDRSCHQALLAPRSRYASILNSRESRPRCCREILAGRRDRRHPFTVHDLLVPKESQIVPI